MNRVGKVEVVLGPMYSGKTSELLRRIRRYRIAGKSAILIKWPQDDRFNRPDDVGTHDQVFMAAERTDELMKLLPRIQPYHVIAIDEGQFFPDLVAFVNEATSRGKIVVVAALDGNFMRRPFPQIADLIPLAEEKTFLTAVCSCGRKAPFTKRISASKELILIGHKADYKAVCRSCFDAVN